MKWDIKQTDKLRELCYKGLSNKAIAENLKCSVTDVYGKRSQLGLTIEKCKGIAPNSKFEKAMAQMEHKGMCKSVKKAFSELNDALLLAMASDWTSEEAAKLYAQLNRAVIELEGLGNEAFGR